MFHKIVSYDVLKVNHGTGRTEANAELSASASFQAGLRDFRGMGSFFVYNFWPNLSPPKSNKFLRKI